MKRVGKFLITIVLGGALGWMAGYLRIPFIEKNNAFWIGFAACITSILVILALLRVWNRSGTLRRLTGRAPASKTPQATDRSSSDAVWIMVGVLTILGGIGFGFLASRQNKLIRTQGRHLDKQFQKQSELIEAVRRSSQVSLMAEILEKVDEEINNNPDGKLSNATIARIAALSYAFKPYLYPRGDSSSAKAYSPERGQFLLALSLMPIDSASYATIKTKTTFAKADLSGANMQGADLSGADLRGADLTDVELPGANLDGADLLGARLWGANLDSASLKGVNLRRTDLRWAEMNKANLEKALLTGADLSGAKLVMAEMRECTIRWARSEVAILIDANLACSDLEGTNFSRASLNRAYLVETNLRNMNLTEANLTGADLRKAVVEEKWMEKVPEWRPIGGQWMQQNYSVETDTTSPFHNAKFSLAKK